MKVAEANGDIARATIIIYKKTTEQVYRIRYVPRRLNSALPPRFAIAHAAFLPRPCQPRRRRPCLCAAAELMRLRAAVPVLERRGMRGSALQSNDADAAARGGGAYGAYAQARQPQCSRSVLPAQRAALPFAACRRVRCAYAASTANRAAGAKCSRRPPHATRYEMQTPQTHAAPARKKKIPRGNADSPTLDV
jgi:hypothetical protein